MDQVNPPRHSGTGRFFLILSVSLIVGLILVFAAYFVYYLWQLKYGKAETQISLEQNLTQQRMTLVGSSDQAGPKSPSDFKKYIHPYNPTIGNPAAKVTILAFVDFQCPFCQAGYPVFSQVTKKYGTAARIVFKYLPLPALHPDAMNAANAAACANEQGKFWDYYTILFTQKKLDASALTNDAETLGLNVSKFTNCFSNHTYQSNIEQDMLDAVDLGVRGTPTYFINHSVIEGVKEMPTWDTTILSNLK